VSQPQTVTCEFEVGDVVVLKSGGPAMTVESWDVSRANKTNQVLCSWFIHTGTEWTGPFEGTFIQGALKKTST
jgi:uncharacterized protein YodC (DUF2158 family)